MKFWARQPRPCLEVWPQALQSRDGQLELGVRLETRGRDPEQLWYQLPAEHEASLTDSLDPFVIGLLFVAMRREMDLHVHGQVSPSLLQNLEEYQAAWHCWHPERYQQIEIRADAEREDSPAPVESAAMMFSGGLDSCFTAWRHTQKLCGRRARRLEAAVMAHGFDIPLEEPEVFKRAAESSRRMAASIGLELIPVASNIRQFEDNWELTHGAGLASCLHLLRRRFPVGLIAASHVYNGLRFPWGSNPVTDTLLSSESLAIVYDGGEVSRRAKAREVAAWSEAMMHVRVCWEGEHKDRNCGQCLRCVGTAICFAVESQPIPASLPIPSLETAIGGLAGKQLHPVSITRLEELLEAARTARINLPWVAALDRCIRLQRAHPSMPPPKVNSRLRKAIRRLLPQMPNLKRAQPQPGRTS